MPRRGKFVDQMLRYLTSGESHGPALTAILEGFPSHLPLTRGDIDRDLARRQGGYGRGGRMKIETDRVEILAGVRWGETTGAPLTLQVTNRDWANWGPKMSADPEHKGALAPVTRPRPGHADLNGAMKYDHRDMRDVLERASARETTMRVAVGAVARTLLEQFDVHALVHVVNLGGVRPDVPDTLDFDTLKARAEVSDVRCVDEEAAAQMRAAIDQAKEAGDSLGGTVEVRVRGVPQGLGSYVQWDRKLPARIAAHVMGIQAFKGVEIGIGFTCADRPGSQVHDEILWDATRGYHRRTNRAGGFEGGITTGEEIVVRGVMKPISTLYKPLQSVDVATHEPYRASVERSDTCAVPAAGVIAEAAVLFVIADALLEKFGGDSLDEIRRNYESYMEHVRKF
jgi:chorismate synthase